MLSAMARRKHLATVAPMAEYIRTYRLTRTDLRTLAQVTGTSLDALTGNATPGAERREGPRTLRAGGRRGRSERSSAKK